MGVVDGGCLMYEEEDEEKIKALSQIKTKAVESMRKTQQKHKHCQVKIDLLDNRDTVLTKG